MSLSELSECCSKLRAGLQPKSGVVVLLRRRGFGAGAFIGVEADGARALIELPDGDAGEDEDDGPEGDEDGGGPFCGEAGPEVEDGVAVVDAQPDGEAVAEESADGESPHEGLAGHFDSSGRKDEGGKRHGRGKDRGERDGKDGVVLHPLGDAGEDVGRDVFFQELHASGVTGGVGEEASDRRTDGGDGDEQDGVGVAGGIENEHDVGDARDGERDEGAVDDGDEEEADEAEVEEEVHEAMLRFHSDGEKGCEGGEVEAHI
jgi:hypothetical protein